MNILVLASVPWDNEIGWSSRRRIAQGLAARGHQVFYSTGPYNVWQRNSSEWQKARWFDSFQEQQKVSVHIPGKLPVSWPGRAMFDRFAMNWSALNLRRQMARKSKSDKLTVIAFHPDYQSLVSALKADYVVYFVYDDLTQTPGWDPRKEAELLSQTNLVVGFSPMMLEHLNDKTSVPIKVMPLGVDMEAFDTTAVSDVPGDLASIPHPRIVYVGSINYKLDWSVTHELVERHPQWHWVFVGPVRQGDRGPLDDPDAYRLWQACLEKENFHYLGPKRHDQVAAYMAHGDVNIMPYNNRQGWWQACYPLKMHEYLAVGKPVVSGDIKAVREFSDVVEVAQDTETWDKALLKAIEQGGAGDRNQRIAVAQANSWNSRIDDMALWLEAMWKS